MKTRTVIFALVLALFLTATGAALAYDAAELPRWVLSGGASDAGGSGGLTLRATLGQPVVGLVTNGSGEISLGQGFWAGGSLPESRYQIYLPLIHR
jgi:hypothetical protein